MMMVRCDDGAFCCFQFCWPVLQSQSLQIGGFYFYEGVSVSRKLYPELKVTLGGPKNGRKAP